MHKSIILESVLSCHGRFGYIIPIFLMCLFISCKVVTFSACVKGEVCDFSNVISVG